MHVILIFKNSIIYQFLKVEEKDSFIVYQIIL